MQELNAVIDNINRDNIGIVTQNQVYVTALMNTDR